MAILAKSCISLLERLSLARQEAAKREIFFACSDEAVTLDEVMRIICAELGRSPPRLSIPTWMAYLGVAPLQFLRWLFRKPKFFVRVQSVRDAVSCRSYLNEKAKRTLGFQPQYGIHDGLAETIKWYRENGFL
ncbi:MAG: hypothetical protein ACE5OZ_09755 [Candidatus Heimdallarchaeota archaeon]